MKHDWFYMKGADKHGPVSTSELRALAQNGQLLPTDLVWREGMKDWKRAGKIAGLFDGASQPQKQATPQQQVMPPPQQPAVQTPPKRPPAPPSNLYEHFVPVIQTAARPPSPSQSLQQPLVERMFQCPYCGRGMVNDPSMAGMAVACPHCGQQFRMPAAARTSSIAVTPRRTTTKSFSKSTAVMTGIGCLCMFLCCGVLGTIIGPSAQLEQRATKAQQVRKAKKKEENLLASALDHPPPILKALSERSEVWELVGFDRDQVLYVVFSDGVFDLAVTKQHYPKGSVMAEEIDPGGDKVTCWVKHPINMHTTLDDFSERWSGRESPYGYEVTEETRIDQYEAPPAGSADKKRVLVMTSTTHKRISIDKNSGHWSCERWFDGVVIRGRQHPRRDDPATEGVALRVIHAR